MPRTLLPSNLFIITIPSSADATINPFKRKSPTPKSVSDLIWAANCIFPSPVMVTAGSISFTFVSEFITPIFVMLCAKSLPITAGIVCPAFSPTTLLPVNTAHPLVPINKPNKDNSPTSTLPKERICPANCTFPSPVIDTLGTPLILETVWAKSLPITAGRLDPALMLIVLLPMPISGVPSGLLIIPNRVTSPLFKLSSDVIWPANCTLPSAPIEIAGMPPILTVLWA